RTGPMIILSRTHPEFVKKILELEVPEIYDGTVEVFKIVREPGYRTKIAVYSKREDIDPVGACVGLKGIRIQSIIRELEGEKVDILKYELDSKRFIRNALSPAEVKEVYILDESRHMALAVVPDSQLSIAIGKLGQNVRLANRLCDWSIDVKTEEQFLQLDRTVDMKRAVSELFGEAPAEEDFEFIADLPGVDIAWVDALKASGIERIEDFLELSEAEIAKIDGIDPDAVASIKAIIEENVEIVEEAEEAGPVEETETVQAEEYECPDCGTRVTPDMDRCPNCGVELSFEYEDDQEV
ncbi:MAG: transcription termination/antitermination protein NusA, partial [Rectinema sp.]